MNGSGRALVVHPDPDVAGRLAAAVGRRYAVVEIARDGERAIDRFLQAPYDLVVLEMRLPGRDGATTARTLRGVPGGERVPILFVATRGSVEGLEATAQSCGAIAALAGDVDESRLLGVIASLGTLGPSAEGADEATRIAHLDESMPTLRDADPDSETVRRRAGASPVPVAVRLPDLDLDDQRTLAVPARSVARLPRFPSERLGQPSPFDAPATDSPAPRRPATLPPPPAPTSMPERPHAPAAQPAPRAPAVGARASPTDPGAAVESQDVAALRLLAQSAPGARGGTLLTVSFARLLAQMRDERASGALVLTSVTDERRTIDGGPATKVVYLKEGRPRYVRSNLVQECLGQILARDGRIDGATLDESLARVRAGEGRQGAVLVAMGALSPHELRDVLEEQLKTKLADLFAWTSGEWRLLEGIEVPPEAVTLDRSLAELVFAGVARRLTPQRLVTLLGPHLDGYVVPEPTRSAELATVPMETETRRLLASLDGTQTVRDVLARAPRGVNLPAIVYALDALGIAPIRTEPAPGHRLALETGAPLPDDPERVRTELLRIVRALRANRIEEALGVDPSDRERVLAAVDRMRARFAGWLEPGPAGRELRSLASEVCGRLLQVRDELERRGAPEPPPVDRPTSVIEAPGASLPPTAPQERRLRETDDRARPTPRTGPRSEPVPEGAHDLDESARPTLPERERATLPESPSARPAPIPSSATTPATGVGSRADPSLDERVARTLRAERHARSGERALRRGAFDEARRAFERAVELCPDEPEFLAWLAYLRHRSAAEDRAASDAAVAELQRVAAVAPRAHLPHLLLGRARWERGERSEARVAYERALAARPDCTEALEALRARD
ncbi:MAG: response regulator [Myxococcales bacterium]|nr:response regulator [Myxococcales bacterium]